MIFKINNIGSFLKKSFMKFSQTSTIETFVVTRLMIKFTSSIV